MNMAVSLVLTQLIYNHYQSQFRLNESLNYETIVIKQSDVSFSITLLCILQDGCLNAQKVSFINNYSPFQGPADIIESKGKEDLRRQMFSKIMHSFPVGLSLMQVLFLHAVYINSLVAYNYSAYSICSHNSRALASNY